MHPEDRSALAEWIKASLDPLGPGLLNAEFRVIRPDGSARWVSARGRVFFSGEEETRRPVCATGTLVDITERKQAEEVLVRSQAELKAIYDHSPVMMCVVDADRRVLYANPTLTAFTGNSHDDLTGGHACGVFGCINALDDPRGCGFGTNCRNCALRLAIEETFKTGTGHHNIEHHITLVRDGNRREVSLLGSTALIQTADQNHLLLCLNDITAHRRAEQDYRTLFREMLDGFALHEIICDGQGNPADYRFLAVNPAFEA